MAAEIKVGTGVMIFKDNKVLLGLRKNTYGAGTYCFPGGIVEHRESLEQCAIRETQEETMVQIKNVKFQTLINSNVYDREFPNQVITVGFIADWASGEPIVAEPNKFQSWAWYDLENLPQNLFVPSKLIIESYKTGKVLFDE